MKSIAIILAIILFIAPAAAQDAKAPPAPAPQAAPQPVPLTLSPQELNELNDWLQKQPYAFSQPLIAWLGAKEQAAAARTPKPEASKIAP